MYKTLLQLEWKGFIRSANSGRNLLIRIFFIFLFLYFAAIITMLSASAYFIIKDQMPEADVLRTVSKYLIYYYGFEFLIRLMLQKIPIVKLKPLLVQNIEKRQLIHFLLGKSFFSIFNAIPLFAFTPFAITLYVQGAYPTSTIVTWWIGVMLISLFLNYFTLYLQKKIAKSTFGLGIIMAVYAIIYALQYFGIIDIPQIIGDGIIFLTSNVLNIFIVLALILMAYFADFYDYQKDLYIEEKNPDSGLKVNKMQYFWIDYFGQYGPYLHNDIRLIWRNKRAKNTLMMSGLILLYGLMFMWNPQFQENENVKFGTYYFLGMFMTGIFAMNFGQFIPAWDSKAYGLFSTANIRTKEYLTSKVILMVTSVVITSPFVFLYCFIDMDVVWPFFAGIFTNFGIVIPVLLFFSQYNYKAMDMGKSPMLNYQGMGWTQWVGVFGVIIITILMFSIITYFSNRQTALIAIQVISIIGIIALPWVFKKIAEGYKTTKYKRIDGFKA